MKQKVVLFWFRRDLRLHDNAGLYAALQTGLPVVPLFIFDRAILDALTEKQDRRVSFIYAALEAMQELLVKKGSTLDVCYGLPADIFNELVNDYDIAEVHTNRDYEPYATERDGALEKQLAAHNIPFRLHKDQVHFEQSEIVKADGTHYRMFTPYFNRWFAAYNKIPIAHYNSEAASNFFKSPYKPMPTLPQMGFEKVDDVPAVELPTDELIAHYDKTRNVPGISGTTRMGVNLRFGTVSVRELAKLAAPLNAVYVKEMAWREFFMQLLWHQPRLVTNACKPEFDAIKFRQNDEEFERWCNGQTGYPLIDAGMRELNETGFMHNRVRMVAASFLVKDLLMDWRLGEAYFAKKLLDYELASNNGNWQWVAGCGCDAAPYFRIFNPSSQALKFDRKAVYIKYWVPEHGTSNYVTPMVDHNDAAQRCLQEYKKALALKRGTVNP